MNNLNNCEKCKTILEDKKEYPNGYDLRYCLRCNEFIEYEPRNNKINRLLKLGLFSWESHHIISIDGTDILLEVGEE